MSDELKSIEEKINNLTTIVERHITSTTVYRESQTKLLESHSKVLWGNGKPGLETKVDRLENSEKNRVILENKRGKMIWAAITAAGGVLADKFFHFFPK